DPARRAVRRARRPDPARPPGGVPALEAPAREDDAARHARPPRGVPPRRPRRRDEGRAHPAAGNGGRAEAAPGGGLREITPRARTLVKRLLASLLLLGAATIAPAADKIVVGTKSFEESRLLGEIFAQLLEAKTKLDVERRFGL